MARATSRGSWPVEWNDDATVAAGSIASVAGALLAVCAWAQQADNPIQAALEKKDFASAVKLLRPLADSGDGQAQAVLGGLYADGLGTKQNYAEAAALWRKAADQKIATAQLTWACCTGRAVE